VSRDFPWLKMNIPDTWLSTTRATVCLPLHSPEQKLYIQVLFCQGTVSTYRNAVINVPILFLLNLEKM
jgi:hypothetical protein